MAEDAVSQSQSVLSQFLWSLWLNLAQLPLGYLVHRMGCCGKWPPGVTGLELILLKIMVKLHCQGDRGPGSIWAAHASAHPCTNNTFYTPLGYIYPLPHPPSFPGQHYFSLSETNSLWGDRVSHTVDFKDFRAMGSKIFLHFPSWATTWPPMCRH